MLLLRLRPLPRDRPAVPPGSMWLSKLAARYSGTAGNLGNQLLLDRQGFAILLLRLRPPSPDRPQQNPQAAVAAGQVPATRARRGKSATSFSWIAWAFRYCSPPPRPIPGRPAEAPGYCGCRPGPGGTPARGELGDQLLLDRQGFPRPLHCLRPLTQVVQQISQVVVVAGQVLAVLRHGVSRRLLLLHRQGFPTLLLRRRQLAWAGLQKPQAVVGCGLWFWR